MTDTVEYSRNKAGYGKITINRPEKRNAISQEMTSAFKDALNQAKQDSINFLIITGAGERMFCAGGDLKHLHGSLSPDEAFQSLYPMKEVLYDIVSFPVPTLCLLNGDALGGGCEIATACDIRIAREGTKFGFVQSNIGILPGWGGGSLLYEKVHTSFALQWLMEGKVYEAPFLESKGWLHRIVSEQEWDDQEKILEPYTSKSLHQMQILKNQYKKKLTTIGFSALMDEDVRNCASLWDSPAHKKAVEDFLSRSKR
ncbi:enoyl-CoA hydratase/isomerase family protein [Virgibacillus kekensis]|uniref:Enoyl-CoA hydratase/isomerase family protein n=1 Tax=Virgibacillus kekensis TaxID=202261 RepID=A0ABV9DFG8_9BACI